MDSKEQIMKIWEWRGERKEKYTRKRKEEKKKEKYTRQRREGMKKEMEEKENMREAYGGSWRRKIKPKVKKQNCTMYMIP